MAALWVPAVTDRPVVPSPIGDADRLECRQETGEPAGAISWSIRWSANPSSDAWIIGAWTI